MPKEYVLSNIITLHIEFFTKLIRTEHIKPASLLP